MRQIEFNIPGKPGRWPVTLGLDETKPTQAFLSDVLSRGEVVDPPMVEVITGILRRGDLFVDLGAHVGYYTLIAANAVGAAGKVLAFEPNPASAAILRANVRRNGFDHVRVQEACAAEAVGFTPFHLAEDDGECSIYHPRRRDLAGHRLFVEKTALDDLMPEVRFARLIKIDVEGAEPRVIAGAARLLAEAPPAFILCEVNLSALARAGADQDEVLLPLWAAGYEAAIVRPMHTERWADRLLWPLERDHRVAVDYCNVLFSREPHGLAA